MARFLTVILLLFGTIAASSSAAPPVTYRIGGIVVDALTGQPLGLVEVTLASVTTIDDLQTFLTAPDGRFLFSNLAPGKYRLMAGRRGYAVQGFNAHEAYMTAIVAGPGQDSEHLRFRLSPSALLTGTVSDQWNDPVREAEVILYQQSWSAGSRSLHAVNRANTDDLGRYRFAHLLPGTYAIGVIARPWWGKFGIRPSVISRSGAQTGSSGSIEVIEARGSTISADTRASVVSNSALDLVYPVAYFPSAASLADAAKLSLLPGATETADVTLRPVPSIHLHVRVPPPAPAPVANQTDATEGESADVLQTDSGTSVEVVLNADGEHANNIEALRTGISPGLFELSGIPPGGITVIVSGSQGGNDSTTRTQSLQLSANSELDLTPHGPLADVSGVVLKHLDVTERQKEVADQVSHPERFIFMLEFRSHKTSESYTTAISDKGEFSFAGSALKPGTYEVGFSGDPSLQVSSLEATGATVSHRTIDIPAGQPVKLTVHIAEAKCSVAGVAFKDGKPFPGAMILLVPQDPDQDPSQFHRDQSDSDGSFSMAPIFPGRYTLLALENGWDLEWSNPAVLFQYLPNGLPVELKPDASMSLNAKVQ